RTVSGAYSGTLSSVVSKILRGYNFFLKVSGERIEVVIVGLPNRDPTVTMSKSTAPVTNSNATSIPAAKKPASQAPEPTARSMANYNILPGLPAPSQSQP